MPVRTYDPKQVILVVGGAIISGYADGTFITFERDNDAFTKVSGADGIVSRSKSNDKSGTIIITLAQTSASNDILSAFHRLDELENKGVVPALLRDASGRSVIFTGFAWVRKYPSVSFAKEIENREWTLDVVDSEPFVGGNADVELS